MQAWRSIPRSLLEQLVQRLVINKRQPICVISCVTLICIRKKETLQGLRKNMQSKMIFKDHIDRLSTDVQLNNNYMVCGVIFSPRFYISHFLIQYNTSKNLWDNSSLIWQGFRLISYCWRTPGMYIRNPRYLLIICGLVNSIAKVMKQVCVEIQCNGNSCIFADKFINKLAVFQFW